MKLLKKIDQANRILWKMLSVPSDAIIVIIIVIYFFLRYLSKFMVKIIKTFV